MRSSNSLPVLWHFRLSHYNEKVCWALDYKNIPHLRRSLIPGFHMPTAWMLTKQNKVPILRFQGQTLHDSTRIIAFLERTHPEPALYPADVELRKKALEIEEFFDNEVAPALRTLFWSTYLDDSAACARLCCDGHSKAASYTWKGLSPFLIPAFRKNIGVYPNKIDSINKQVPAWFDFLEQQSQATGFLVGDQFTIADLTAASVLTAILRPSLFPYPLPEPWPTALVQLKESFRNRQGFAWMEKIYQNFRGKSCEVSSS